MSANPPHPTTRTAPQSPSTRTTPQAPSTRTTPQSPSTPATPQAPSTPATPTGPQAPVRPIARVPKAHVPTTRLAGLAVVSPALDGWRIRPAITGLILQPPGQARGGRHHAG